jgi:succinate dehydrogenase/fumarate reductase flavoprotein subunit
VGGAGGAGLSAALVAARLGRRVVVLEKNPEIGGTTARSVGSVTSSCTPFQKAKGIDDSPQAHFEDMALFAGDLAPRDNLELRRLLTENVPETFRFLMDLGIEFIGPMPEPPHRVPRMHNIVPNSRGYIYHLARHCRRAGVEIRTSARAGRLLTDDRRVTGVQVGADGGGDEVIARRAVVLAAGDYSSDEALKAEFVAPEIAAVEGVNPTSTGDGQRLARELGAEVLNGDVMLGPEIRFVAPPQRKLPALIPPVRAFGKLVKLSMATLPDRALRPFLMMFVTTNLAPSPALFKEGAILVNRNGERFCDERDRPQLAIPAQPDKVAYILFDARIAYTFTAWPNFISTAPGVAYAYLPDYRRHRKDICFEAPTLEELAGKIGVPGPALAATVAAYNAGERRGENMPPGGRGDRPPLSEPPFCALGPAKSWIVIADGGLRVTPRLEVVGDKGAVLAGLFAAGSTGQGGLLLEGHGHHLGWAFTSGRIAGRNAAFAG